MRRATARRALVYRLNRLRRAHRRTRVPETLPGLHSTHVKTAVRQAWRAAPELRRGAPSRPADLSVEQPQAFEFACNVGTPAARAWTSRLAESHAAEGVDGGYDISRPGKRNDRCKVRVRRSVYGHAFSPDGNRVASSNSPGTAETWDAAAGQPLLMMHGHTSPMLDRDQHRLSRVAAGIRCHNLDETRNPVMRPPGVRPNVDGFLTWRTRSQTDRKARYESS